MKRRAFIRLAAGASALPLFNIGNPAFAGTVAAGRKIAAVGLSGNSLVPHLHFEVLKDGACLDPVHYLFASVSPSDYANMLYMSVNTGQSMD